MDTAMASHHDLSLVALSVVIAIMAAYVAIDLASRVTASQGRTRFLWLAGGAAVLGTGIWSMHFIGMLAFSLPIPVAYHVPTVLASLLAAIGASLIALVVVSGPSLNWPRLVMGSVMMGGGIVTMHYTGMAAMRLQAVARYDALLCAASAAIAVGVSFVGLTLVYRLRGDTMSRWNWRKVTAAFVMGLAIPSMHYTGMAAASFLPNSEFPFDLSSTVDITTLGETAITIGTFFLLGIVLALPKGSVRRPYAALPVIMMVMVVVVLGIGSITLYYIEARLVAEEGESLALAAADIADKLDRTLSERYGDIRVLAQAPVLSERDAAAKTMFLQSIKAAYPYYIWLAVTDANGRIVAATDPATVGKDRSQRDWFKYVRDRRIIHVRDAQTSEDSGGVLAIAFTAPILGPRGEFWGVVTSRVSLPMLEDVFRQTVQALQFQRGPASKIEYQFLSRDGDVIADSLLRQEGIVNLKQLGLPSALSTGSAQPGYIEETHLRRHVPVITGYAQTEQSGDYLGLHWGVLVRMDRNEILRPIRATLWKLGLAGAAVFMPLLSFLLWSAGRLRKEWAIAQEETVRATVAEEEARESAAHTRLIIHTAMDAIIGMDADGRITEWNPQAEVIFGWTHAEAVGRSLAETIIPPQYRDAHTRGLKHFMATGQGPVLNKRIEITALHRDGHEFPVELAISPLLSGETTTFSAFIRDITERKESQRALIEGERRYRDIVDHANDIIYRADAEGRFVFYNPTVVRLLKYSQAELLGRSYLDLIDPACREAAKRFYMRQFLRKIPSTYFEAPVVAKDGTVVWIGQNVQILVENGRATGFQAVARDITERKRMEIDLSIAKDAAEAANRTKSEFLASMSHEIRTPMNAIVGMADLLAETPLNNEQDKYVQIFRRASDNLLNLINDILDLSKVDASQLELEWIGFDLNDVVERVSELLACRAHEKGLELVCHIAQEVPTWLVGDPTRLRQVLINLLSNAIKFTESGEVILRVELEREDSTLNVNRSSKECVLRFSVSDTGIGIPPDKVGKIFERFTQVDSSTTRKYGGTGLGLAISKRLVELMGGRIWVESKLGFGTTFFFTVSLQGQPATERSPKCTPAQLRGLRILVVDDNDTNRLILRELLSSWKAKVTEAATGEAALAELQRARVAATPFELVLLDCRMPAMDGFQVAETIRADPSLSGVTMMMLTSDNRKDHIQRARELGLASYAVKPIRRTDLLEAVATAVSSRQNAVSPALAEVPSEPAAVHRALNILLVEDSADNRSLIQSYLKKTAHHLDVAVDGTIAVAKVRAHEYDLVLMDMQMPVMDGYDATRAIREWERANHRPPTPIIALTAYVLKGDEEKSLAAGCTAHLTKPIKKATLLVAISEYTRSPVI